MENKKLYGENPDLWPEGVRPADNAKEMTLMDDLNPNLNGVTRPDLLLPF